MLFIFIRIRQAKSVGPSGRDLIPGGTINKVQKRGRTMDNYGLSFSGRVIVIGLLAVTIIFSLPVLVQANDFFELCKSGSAEELEQAIEEGAEVNQVDSRGRSPLMVAAKHNSSSVVDVLLKQGSYVNVRSNKGWTALMYAAAHNSSETVRLLIESGASINIRNRDGDTALMLALRSKKNSSAHTLLHAWARVNVRNSSRETPLIIALKEGAGTRVIEMLLDRRARVNDRDRKQRTPLMYAMMNGREDAAREIMEERVKYDRKDREGRTALIYGLQEGVSDKIISLMMYKGAPVNEADERGNTPLMYAVSGNSSPALVEKMVNRYQADVNAINRRGKNALMVGLQEKVNLDLIEALVGFGASVNATDDSGMTSLHYASRYWNNVGVIDLLLNNGANPDRRDFRNRTPLMLAAKYCESEEVIFTLLDHASDPAPRDVNGKRTVEYLEENDALWGTEVYWKLNYLEPEKQKKEPADFKSRKAAAMWAAAVPSGGHAYADSWWPRGTLFLLGESGLAAGAICDEDSRNLYLGLLALVKAWEISDAMDQTGDFNELIQEFNEKVEEFNREVEEER